MIAFRMNLGGAVVIAAVVLIALGAMEGHLAAGLLLGILTVISLLLHECGHMLAARVIGVKVREIGICLKGSYIRRERARQPIEEAAISLSGPMVNALIAAALWNLSGLAHWLAIYNLVLLISNLAPLPGSDGWRIFNAWSQAAAPVRIPARINEKKTRSR